MSTNCNSYNGVACRATVGEIQTLSADYGYVCGVAGGTPGCGTVFGPEFSYAGDAGCSWASPAGNVAGLYGSFNCRRSQNTADTKSCCLNLPTGNKSCPPSTDMNNGPVCNVYWQAKCAGSAIMGSDCQKWAGVQPVAAAGIMGSYCNTADGLKNPLCRAWCIKNGGCDAGATGYCADGGAYTAALDGAGFCGCLRSTSQRPDCFDHACTSGGYRTGTMRNGAPCGTLVNCVQNNNIDGMANVVDRNQLIMNCTNNNNYTAPLPPIAQPPPPVTIPSTPPVVLPPVAGAAPPTDEISGAPPGAIPKDTAIPPAVPNAGGLSASDLSFDPATVWASYGMYILFAVVLVVIAIAVMATMKKSGGGAGYAGMYMPRMPYGMM